MGSAPPNDRSGLAAGVPPGLTAEVETGHNVPPLGAPIPPPESVLNDNDAPEPAVDGAAIGSAIATAAEQQSGLCFKFTAFQ